VKSDRAPCYPWDTFVPWVLVLSAKRVLGGFILGDR